ncbi:MAG: methylmalonyl-CoA epimerase [Rhodobacteraceae bacterium]|nr:methylmalonyl-CoA epimerase [Paracoccaceae bacterium]
MIGKLNHVAIAVPNIAEAVEPYKNIFAAEVSTLYKQPLHGVQVIFVTLPNTKIELISPFGANSPISNFLKKNPNGGIHHICYEVESIDKAIEDLSKENYRIIEPGVPKIGAHGKPVIFLHPSEFNNTLIELQEK